MAEVNVGRRIREARETRGWTQQEVARLVGMTQRAVSYVEKQAWVKQSTLERYAQVLDKPLSFFLRPYGEAPWPSGLSREEAVQQAFAIVARDPEFGFGRRPEEALSVETRADIVRLYERCKGVRLLAGEGDG